MGKLTTFQIYYDSPLGNYYSGGFVEGHVTINVSAPLKIRGVHIKFKGKAGVMWTEEDHHEGTRRETFTAKEKYFEHDILLYGNAPSENYCAVELATGHHDLPFRFQLPQGLPASFEGSNGHVRYMAKAKIVMLDKKDHEVKRPFVIDSIVDLNLRPEYRSAVSGSNQKHLCCCCCKSGPISAQFYIEKQGWVSGEAMRLYADIRNGASRTIDKSYVAMIMKTMFHASGKTKEETKEVARVTRPSIPAHAEDSWRGELLFIPSLAPSSLGGCNIIDVQYIVKLVVDPSTLSFDLEIPLSIVIGTIPLSIVDQLQVMGHSFPHSVSNIPSAPSAPPAFPSQYGFPNQPPPSYMESVFTAGGTCSEDSKVSERTRLNTSRSFTPSYTNYNNWGETPDAMPDPKK